MATIEGSFLHVLQYASVVFYRGNGISAYYEQPTPQSDGYVYINGRRIARTPYSNVCGHTNTRDFLKERNVPVDSGWTCTVKAPDGLTLMQALSRSAFGAIRYHDGHITVQRCEGQKVAIFVDAEKRWVVDLPKIQQCLAELNADHNSGWLPVQEAFYRV